MRLWDALIGLFSRFRRRRPIVPPILALPPPRPVRGLLSTPEVIYLPDQSEKARRPRVLPQPATLGQFYFRGAILDQLDDYMEYVRRMKRGDSEAYGMYSRLGAWVNPDFRAGDRDRLSPWFLKNLPSFGAVAWLDREKEKYEDDHKVLWPRFMYFTRYKKQSSQVEWRTGGTRYTCTAYWDKKTENKWAKWRHGAPQDFPVIVYPDGRVELLRVMLNAPQIIRHRRDRSYSVVQHQRWGIYPGFLAWAEDNKEAPHSFLVGEFISLANTFECVNSSMIRVTARKDGLTAAFGVDVTRTPYFFADRDVTVSESGAKQRIFHIVRPHLRAGRGVKMHFRGLRRFRWNGYDVHITVPGRDHPWWWDADFGAIDEEWMEKSESYLSQGELGERLARLAEKSIPNMMLNGVPRRLIDEFINQDGTIQ